MSLLLVQALPMGEDKRNNCNLAHGKSPKENTGAGRRDKTQLHLLAEVTVSRKLGK